MLESPSGAAALVVGGGTMGADVALVLARAGCRVTVLESASVRREKLTAYFTRGMSDLGYPQHVDKLSTCASLDGVAWKEIDQIGRASCRERVSPRV